MKTRAKNQVPDDAVLLIPDIEDDSGYGVKPGYYNKAQMLALIRENRKNSLAIGYIADMLETGNEEDDGFSAMLRNARHNPTELARIVQICRD